MSRTKIASGGIEITDFCNLNCLHCYIGKVQTPKHIDLNRLLYIVDEFIKYKADYVVISGGEPFMHPQIDKIIDEIGKKYCYFPFIITTNGSFLNDYYINKIKKYKNIQLQISLDGATKRVHEQQHGSDTFCKIYKVLKRLKNVSRERKIIRMTVSKINYRDCVEVAKLSDRFNTDISYSYVCKIGRANQNWDKLRMSLAQQMYVDEEIKRYSKISGRIIVPPQSVLTCPFESYNHIFGATVHTNGDVDICTCLDGKYIVGNIFQDQFSEILNSATIDTLTQKILSRKEKLKSSKCNNCIINFKCQQGCIGRATYLGDEFGLDDQCDYRKALMFKNFYMHLNKKNNSKQSNNFVLE